jgi:sphingosine-1-phosphate phosphotase 2
MTGRKRRTRSKTPSKRKNVVQTHSSFPSIRAMLKPWAESESGVRFFDEYRTPVLDYFFKYFPFLGNEIQYIILMPFAAWILDPGNLSLLTTTLTLKWFLSVFFANVVKDLLCLERCGAVDKRLTHDVDDQFGFPSTHSAAAISVAVPLLTFFFSDDTESVWLGSFAYTVLVATSRLYLGVHSVTDILGGILVGLLSVCICDFVLDDAVLKIANYDDTKLVIVLLCALVAVVIKLYPDARVNNTCFQEVLAVCGLLVGGLIAETMLSKFTPCYVTQNRPGSIMLTGLLVLILFRSVVKSFTRIVLARGFNVNASVLYVFEHAALGAFVIAAPTKVLDRLAGC